MDTLYSLLLASSLGSGGLSFAGMLLLKLRRIPMELSRAVQGAAILSLVLDAGSFLVHLAFGHTPGTEGAMSFVQFFREHPAFLIALLPGLLALRFSSES